VIRRFLAGYLAYSYGRPSSLPDATDLLRAQLLAQSPNVPPAVRGRRPHLVALTVVANTPADDRALATISDGVQRYPIELDVTLGANGWLVSDIDPE